MLSDYLNTEASPVAIEQAAVSGKTNVLGLERWCGGCECLWLFQKTSVRFPASTWNTYNCL